MNSELLSQIGIDPAYIFIGILAINIILFILVITSLIKQKRLKRKYDGFLRGKDAESMEEAIMNKFAEIDKLKLINKKHRMEIDEINEILKLTYQKVGIEKYDAFKEMGGDLSFAIAMLDSSNNGFILNAIHSREGCYTYIKDIKNGESKIELSKEEKSALQNAMV